ncbi:MAG: energy transducer TonB [Myxococcaceae bacterium]
MSEATLPGFRRDSGTPWLVAAFIASVVGHLAFLYYLDAKPDRAADYNKIVELEMVQVEPPKPPPPKEEPKEEEKKAPPKPAPIKVAVVKPPPPPVDDAPPPPNDTPPPETPAKPVPLVVGISMSSTTASGGFAAPVGNTMYGKTAEKAIAPQEVKPYYAPKYTPVYQVDSEPSVASEVKVPYPPEAIHAEIEGSVLLSIVIDDSGKVVNVKVVKGLGYGCDEAAQKALFRFRFKPAIKNGEPVSTTIPYRYTFVLPP